MKDKELQVGLSIRKDHYSCPLSLQIDTYYNCEINCLYCKYRKLNEIWGKDGRVRPVNLDRLFREFQTGLTRKKVNWDKMKALNLRKTVLIGSKADPLQPLEDKYERTKSVLLELLQYKYSFVLQTRFTSKLMEYASILRSFGKEASVMTYVTPQLETDWKLFERGLTTNPIDRLRHISLLRANGVNCGVRLDQFIMGYHTLQDFANVAYVLSKFKIPTVSVYVTNVDKWMIDRFVKFNIDVSSMVKGELNEDDYSKLVWSMIQIGRECGVTVYVPNSGLGYRQEANTCCGINVPNPMKCNTHYWQYMLQTNGSSSRYKYVFESSYEGIGDKEELHDLFKQFKKGK